MGERAHLATPQVTLGTHVDDVAAVLEYEDLRDVVLVGHSYAGMVITGVAERSAERLRKLVYLDAFVPQSGNAVIDLLPEARVAMYHEVAGLHGDGWRVPLEWIGALDGWGVTAEEHLQWMVPRMTPQPLATFTQPVASAAAAQRLPRSFVHCTHKPGGDPFARFAEAAARARSEWQHLLHVNAGHDAMVTAPAALATALKNAAGDA
jgi:pimeloyl-ACP methyl ester carboxylesterase